MITPYIQGKMNAYCLYNVGCTQGSMNAYHVYLLNAYGMHMENEVRRMKFKDFQKIGVDFGQG